SDRHARAAGHRNLGELALLGRVRQWPLRLPAGLSRLGAELAAADVIFADPPYGGEDARVLIARLGRTGVMKPGARLVLETHAKDEVPAAAGELLRERDRRYGETMVHVYRAGSRIPEAPVRAGGRSKEEGEGP